jgi:hypothetical protein
VFCEILQLQRDRGPSGHVDCIRLVVHMPRISNPANSKLMPPVSVHLHFHYRSSSCLFVLFQSNPGRWRWALYVQSMHRFHDRSAIWKCMPYIYLVPQKSLIISSHGAVTLDKATHFSRVTISTSDNSQEDLTLKELKVTSTSEH